MTDMKQPVLSSGRLTLRPLKPDDDLRIFTLANHRSVSEMTAQIPYPYPRELAAEWIKKTIRYLGKAKRDGVRDYTRK